MYKLLIVFCLLMVIISSNDRKLIKELQYKKTEYIKKDCPVPREECVKLIFEYPKFITENQILTDSINAVINKWLLHSIYPGIYLSSIEALKDTVYKEIDSFNSVYSETPMSVFLERNVLVTMDKNEIITFSLNETRQYSNSPVKKKTKGISISKDGKVINLEKLLKKGYQFQLKKIAEKVFRKTFGIEEKDSFFKKGFYFEGNKFFLPESFVVLETGLRFDYKKTELSNDEGASTSFVIAYKEIKSLIPKNSILHRFL